jgi:hypothetical protein
VTRLATIALVMSCALSAPALADEMIAESHPSPLLRPDKVEAGEHWRLVSDNGVVHVWKPSGYDERTAGTVVYLHGHRSSADESWDVYHMATQFRQSGLNALFIVPDSTTDGEEGLHWESLGALRRYVARETGVARPPGKLVVIGHSGAFRNIVAWLGDRDLSDLILLDALYSYEDEFRAWITSSKGHEKKRLTLVSQDTRRNAMRFMRAIPASVGVKKFPGSYDALDKKAKGAQVVNFRSPYDHMAIVTSGAVIPLVLKRADLRAIGGSAPAPGKPRSTAQR